jgi:sortase A
MVVNSGRQRVPYFERPAPPHDWRWVVGLTGKVFITLGLLMFAFVAYQLWGTGIQTAQAQNDLEDQFQELLQNTTTVAPTTTVTTTPTPDSTSPQSTTTSTIPVAPAGPLTEGSPVAKLKIPSIGLDWTVVEGVGVPDLKKGPGHFPETPLPGQLGNAAIAGHRTTYGAPFFDLDKVEVGDTIEVGTLAGLFIYEVTGTTVVQPSEYASVIPTVDPDVATLTLATCTPAYTARERLIVFATLVPESSAQVMRPPSASVPGDTLPGETTAGETTLPSETLPSETLPGEAVPDTSDPATSDTGTSDPSDTSTVAVPVGQDSAGQDDAFAQGWFGDTGAIPQALLWGLVLVAVAVGAWFAGKRANRLWVSFLVGAVPFVVVLYFFFENINRLLPPSL